MFYFVFISVLGPVQISNWLCELNYLHFTAKEGFAFEFCVMFSRFGGGDLSSQG